MPDEIQNAIYQDAPQAEEEPVIEEVTEVEHQEEQELEQPWEAPASGEPEIQEDDGTVEPLSLGKIRTVDKRYLIAVRDQSGLSNADLASLAARAIQEYRGRHVPGADPDDLASIDEIVGLLTAYASGISARAKARIKQAESDANGRYAAATLAIAQARREADAAVARAERRSAELEARVAELDDLLAASDGKIDGLLASVASAETMTRRADEATAAQRERAEDLQRQLEATTKDCDDRQAEVANLQRQLLAARQALEDAREQARQDLDQADAHARQDLDAVRAQAREDLDQADAHARVLADELASARLEIARLTAQAEGHDALVTRVEGDLQRTRAEREELRTALTEAIAAKAAVEARMERLIADNDALAAAAAGVDE